MFRGGDNNSQGRDFGKRDYGEKRFGGGDRERPQMHEATCSDCGKRCEVPFKPSGDRPIYCSDCFSSHRESPSSDNRSPRRDFERSSSNSFPRRESSGSRFQDREMFDAICAKCGAKFELPFRPIGDKPVYCKGCFSQSGSCLKNDKPANQYKEQFDMLNAKLDRIIKALAPVIPEEKEKAEEISEVKKIEDKIKKAAKKPEKIAASKVADKKKKSKK